MKLYHFTSKHHVDGCLSYGISKGVLPVKKNDNLSLKHGYQWLTTSPEFSQEWCNPAYSSLPYDRTEFRLTIKIPKHANKKLFKWLDNCANNDLAADLNAFADPENWWLFKGTILPKWIKGIKQKRIKQTVAVL